MFDGRIDYFTKTWNTLDKLSKVDKILINDDSGDVEATKHLIQNYADRDLWILSSGERSGFGGAIRNAWTHLGDWETDYVFHLEQDFELTKDIDIESMITVLEENPNVSQLALRRQPWNETEKKAGGIVESNPYDFYERKDLSGNVWLEHRKFWTTNPCLYRSSLMNTSWPTGANSEGMFGINLFEDAEQVSGYWGSRDSGEWCKHVGDNRIGTGY